MDYGIKSCGVFAPIRSMSSASMLLCCGGVAETIKEKTQILARSCNIPLSQTLSILDRSQYSLEKRDSRRHTEDDTLVIEKCGHRLPTEQYCSFCEQNRQQMTDKVRLLLEQKEGSNSTLVVADMCSSSAMWSYDQTMEILSDMLPRSALGTMLVLPFRRLHGWDAYFASYCFALSLQSSTYTIIRNLGEHLFVEDGSSGTSAAAVSSNGNRDVVDCAEKIAADIIPNFLFQERFNNVNIHGISWPYSVCSYTDRVIDIRSSLYYKLQMVKKKKPSRDHLHPLKVVTSSLHRLGLFYQDLCVDDAHLMQFNQQDDYLIDYRDMIYDRKYGDITMDILKGQHRRSGHDMCKLFHHATPGLSWKSLEDFLPSQQLDEPPIPSNLRNSVATIASGRSAYSHQVEIPRGQVSAAFMSTASSKSGIALNSDDKNIPEHLEGLGCLAFQSPFGEMELLRTSQYCRAMLSKGGYRHLFDSQFDENSLRDSLSIIDTYLSH